MLCMICLDQHAWGAEHPLGPREYRAINPAITIHHGNALCLEHLIRAAEWSEEAASRAEAMGQKDGGRAHSRRLEIACISPASGGFGLWQLGEWQSEGDKDLGDFASDGDYTISDLPGERFAGLIQGESDAQGWLLRQYQEGPDDEMLPLAYRVTVQE
jgi:hypothetical protein